MADALAAVDIGTNSFHLIVVRVFANQRFEVIASEKEMIRLGSGSGDMKLLTEQSIDRGVACLARFRQVAEISGAELTAVATSAVREAENRDVFLERCRVEAGVDVEVISGIEEARLIHLGVLHSVPVFDRQLALIDIGGGSTEFLVGKGQDVLWSRSLKVGAIRISERFFPLGRTSPSAAEACVEYLESFLAPSLAEAVGYGFDVAVGSSGTIENLVAMAALARDGRPPRSVNNLAISKAELDDIVERLIGAETNEERAELPGVEPRRADLLPAGALILQAAMRQLGANRLVASAYALREGVVLDRIRERSGARPGPNHLSELRRSSIQHALERHGDDDLEHSVWATELALQLFIQTRHLHLLDDTGLDFLEAGGLLANIGRSIAHDAHHLHSAYLIRNTEHLTGFTAHEVELIAQVARYHRKSAPKAKHSEYAALRSEDQRMIRVLAGILRVAIGLDRGHRRIIQSVLCRYDPEARHLVIMARSSDPAAAGLELYTASARTGLMAAALDVTVEVKLAPLALGSR